jgi:signal transduction histidine kinase
VRRRLSILVAATTSAVVLAFLIPLALLLRTLAEDRVIGQANVEAQTAIAVAVASTVKDRPVNLQDKVGARTNGTSVALYDFTPGQNGRVYGGGPTDPVVAQVREAKAGRQTRNGDRVVVYAVSVSNDDGGMVARVEVEPEALHAGVLRSTAIITALGLILLAAAVLAADRLARRVSEPIQRVADAADAMREGSLDVRVPETGAPEVVTLATALNRLAERVGRLLSAERDAVADLSHRLRTPVTALRLDTEMISDPDVAERLRTHITQLERTVDAIVHDARRPVRADAAGSCDAARVVRERVAFWSALAEEQDRPLRTAVPDRPLRAKVDASDLSDVVDVLLDNVFAHTDDGVPIEVWVVPRADGAIVLTVEDGGPGLPAGDIVSRGSSGAGSTGLGLDIARRAALASGGWLELGQSRLGGALVRVVLGHADR